MLGGTAPVMVFNFATISTQDLLKKIGIGLGLDSFFNFDIPLFSIPVYLDEELTGIIADETERSINVEYETDGLNNYEREISSDVKITLKAQKDNIAFQAFLAMFETVLKKLDPKLYKIYFYYDDVFMTDAGLKDFSSSTMQNRDTKMVTFTLTNRSQKSLVAQTILKNVGESLKDFLK